MDPRFDPACKPIEEATKARSRASSVEDIVGARNKLGKNAIVDRLLKTREAQ